MFDFAIKPEGGDPFRVTAESRDVLNWEKTSRGKTFQGLMENLAMADLYKLAHLAAKRQQLYTGTLAEFEESCELEFDDGQGDVDPTRPAPTPEG